MALFLMASIAGLFPVLTLPWVIGRQSIHPFDLLFVACLVFASMKRAFKGPDWGLIAAGAAVVAASGIALWVHPSGAGQRVVTSLAYSVVVLLSVAHIRLDLVGVRLDRVLLGPLALATGIAWGVFLVENLTGVRLGPNQSAALPSQVNRLGGWTGANALILFLCAGAPFVRAPWSVFLGILLPTFATLSRSMLGVGVALIAKGRILGSAPGRAGRAVGVASWLCVALGLFAYAFAVVPVKVSERGSLRIALDAGGYLTPHVAALRMLWLNPGVGVGPARFVGEFQHFTSEDERNRLATANRSRRDPHSAILGLAAEQGLLGLAAFTWLMAQVFKRVARIQDPEMRAAAMAGIAGLLMGGHFVDWLALKGLWLWIGLMVASESSTQGNLRGTFF